MMQFLNKPYYIFRPKQIWSRIRLIRPPIGIRIISLPWGAPIELDSQECIGRAILLRGIFDLAVSETLWRLADPGETAVDAGANIGYMTSILSARLKTKGRVYAFEPNPQVYPRLQRNGALWSSFRDWAPIEVWTQGLSDQTAEKFLYLPSSFETNQGLATIHRDMIEDGKTDSVPISVVALDDALPPGIKIGVLKIDVEGHEEFVVQGARKMIREGRIRDIIFESHQEYPTTMTDFLEKEGYHLFRMTHDFWRVHLRAPTWWKEGTLANEAPSYLATKDPARAKGRLRRRGWAVLGW